MDILEVKRRYAGRLCVMGNIDLGYTLTCGTPAEVATEVRTKLHDLAPGGGYCLGSSNSVPDYVPIKNYRAMVETALELGRY
jgi:uroporphyrinogen decarboxylase